MTGLTCPYGDESLVVAEYLAGRLSGPNARSFEMHSFGCNRCFDELQRAIELRAAAEAESRTNAMSAAPSGRPWQMLGIAAAVVLAVGVWLAQPTTEQQPAVPEPVYRDAVKAGEGRIALSLDVSKDGETVTLRWPSVQGAERYTVRVWTESGEPIVEQQTRELSLVLRAARSRPSAEGDLYAQVLALDEMQQVVGSSELVRL